MRCFLRNIQLSEPLNRRGVEVGKVEARQFKFMSLGNENLFGVGLRGSLTLSENAVNGPKYIKRCTDLEREMNHNVR